MATEDISKIFITETKTVYNIFTAGDSNRFVIPEFQRKFSWSNKEFKRLFDDIKACMNHENMPLFLGATILCDDDETDKYNDAGRTAKSIIDGQQRFSAFVFIATIFYCYLWAEENKIYKYLKESNKLPEDFNWDRLGDLFYSIDTERATLLKIFQTSFPPRGGGSDINAPSVIRKNDDFWSSKPDGCKNKSDIAAYCSSVIDKIQEHIGSLPRTEDAVYSINPDELIKIIKQSRTGSNNKEKDKELNQKLKKLNRVVLLLEKELTDFINETTHIVSTESNQESMEDLSGDNTVSEDNDINTSHGDGYDENESQNQNEPDEDDEDNVPNKIDIQNILEIIKQRIEPERYQTLTDLHNSEGKNFEPLLRIFAITLYFLYKVVVIEVKVTKPDYKFDIFDALNTTGQPLTAFESFYSCVLSDSKMDPFPKVIEKLKAVSDELASMTKKVENTSRMIITYAISYYADLSINNNIQVQRFFMNNQFKVKCRNEEEKKNSVLNFYSVFRIYKDFYLNRFTKKPKGMSSEKINFHAIKFDDNDDTEEINFDRNCKLDRIEQLCMQTLVTSKHRLALAPVAVAYGKFLQGAEEEKEKLFNEFTAVLRIVTAFSTLYRLYSGGQARGIDSVYKNLMTSFLTDDENKEFKRVDTTMLTPDEVRKKLIKVAFGEDENSEDSITDQSSGKDDKKQDNFLKYKNLWTNKVKTINAYDSLKPFTQLTLFLLQDNTTLLDDDYKLALRPFKDFKCSYRYENQLDYDYQIEHVAPQENNNNKDWDENIYDINEPMYSQIGNLLVIPSKHNKIHGNQSFEGKINNIRHINVPTQDKQDELTKKEGPRDNLDTARHQEAYKVLERVFNKRGKDGWNKALIEERSENVADLAYDLLNTLFVYNENKFIDS